jgi:hypothetical protein
MASIGCVSLAVCVACASQQYLEIGGVVGDFRTDQVAAAVNKNYGYLVLESERVRGAKTVCLFESSMLEVLSPVQKGQTVNLHCLFSKIVGDPKDPVPAFYGCTVDS